MELHHLWIILGILLLIAEIGTAGFVVGCFAIAALFTSIGAYFDILIKLRSEGVKYIPFINGSNIIQTIKLDPANYVDVMVYKNVNYKIFNLAVSLSAENLQSKKLVIDNMKLFNNRYSVNVHLSIL